MRRATGRSRRWIRRSTVPRTDQRPRGRPLDLRRAPGRGRRRIRSSRLVQFRGCYRGWFQVIHRRARGSTIGQKTRWICIRNDMNENGYGVYLMKWMNAMYEMNYDVEEEEDGRRVGRQRAGVIGHSPSRRSRPPSRRLMSVFLQFYAFRLSSSADSSRSRCRR